MSKAALKEIFHAPSDKFNIMIKNTPPSEKPEILKFLQQHLSLLENLK